MMSPQTRHFSPDFLTAELQAHGLQYLVGPQAAPSSPRVTIEELLVGLARQQDARLRSALIPLFLQQPHVGEVVSLIMKQLRPQDQMTLKVYYTAAVILQNELEQKLREHIMHWRPLPDHYSEELGVDCNASIDTRLQQLGARHAQLTGLTANWPGTYRHAAKRLIRRLQQEARWAA